LVFYSSTSLFQHLDEWTKGRKKKERKKEKKGGGGSTEYKKFVLKIELGPLIIPTGRRSTNHSTKNLRHTHKISLQYASFICNITVSVNKPLYL
jgi:hypothetical protein